MNYVKFSGEVARVSAYTNAEVEINKDDITRFIEREHYFEFTLVNREWNETNWIKARFPKKQWNEFFKTHKPEDIKLLGVEGAIKTAISRGSGYVSNYIEVNKITVCLTK